MTSMLLTKCTLMMKGNWMSKEKLLISFSGGQTSAYMANKLIEEYSGKYEMVSVFANTGCEHEKTLEFVREASLAFGIKTVWIEAVINEGRSGTGYKVVDFESASRDGEPFKAMCAKYGLPNQSYPHCTRELKLQPIDAYLKSIPSDEKIVLATQYGPVSHILHSHFKDRACFIHSRLDRAERFEEMTRFDKNDSKRVMILTVKTAGVGINLTRANHLILVDVLYNKRDMTDQLVGRLHRYGQTRKIQVHHLLMRDSLEEKLYNFLQDYHWSAEYICTLLNEK